SGLSFCKAKFSSPQFHRAGGNDLCANGGTTAVESGESIDDILHLHAAADEYVRSNVLIGPCAAVDVVHDGRPRHDPLLAGSLDLNTYRHPLAGPKTAFGIGKLII